MNLMHWQKSAAGLPLPDIPPQDVSDIHVGGGPAPTPAKKWILNRRIMPVFIGTHWTSWLPLKGTRRAYWLQWLWGNVRWEGCGHPWSKDTAPCALCGTTHHTTVHDRLTQCPAWNSASPVAVHMGRLETPHLHLAGKRGRNRLAPPGSTTHSVNPHRPYPHGGETPPEVASGVASISHVAGGDKFAS